MVSNSASVFHVVYRDHGDDLLRQHVERVARVPRGFDARVVHGARDGGARDQVAAELGHDHAAARGANGVTGAADPLHAAGDRRRRLDLDHEIDRAHVDAELQRRGRDERRAGARPSGDPPPRCAAAWQAIRDGTGRAFLPRVRSARERAAPRVRRLFTKMSVERCARTSSRSLGWMALQIECRAGAREAGPLGMSIRSAADRRHVLDRYLNAQFEVLLLATCRRW